MTNITISNILLPTASQGETERLPDSEKTKILRDQETALVKLGELYRDQKCVFNFPPDRVQCNRPLICRNPQGLADVITLSRAFMSSTAKAKTAKLSKSATRSMSTPAYVVCFYQFGPSSTSSTQYPTVNKLR
jgi:hypothetical protein